MSRWERGRGGFSLIEIALALGVVGFAIVGIMGLLPVALGTARESQRETRATMIARQIFSDLQATSGANRTLLLGSATGFRTGPITLSPGTNVFLAFDQDSVCSNAPITPEGFSGGLPGAAFVASVSTDPNTGITGLSKVQTTLEAPGSVPSASRSKFTFVTLMGF